MNNILITSAGQRVSLVRSFQEVLKKNNSKVYTVDCNPTLAPACIVSDGYKSISKVTDHNYINELLEICIEWNIKIIIPTIDTELEILSCNKKIFISNNIIPIISEYEFIKICRDKRLTNIFFSQHNICTPKEIDIKNPCFPLFIKPYDGSLSKDIYVIQDYNDLTDYHKTNPKLMFMEYIDPKYHDEYTIDTYYNKKNYLTCAIPRKRIHIRAGEINKGLTQKNEIIPFLLKNLNYISGAYGCITIQVFMNKNTKKIIGIEINPRFGGGFPLSYLAGGNFPQFIIDEYIFDKELNYFEDWENNLLMLRYDDEILIHNYNEQ